MLDISKDSRDVEANLLVNSDRDDSEGSLLRMGGVKGSPTNTRKALEMVDNQLKESFEVEDNGLDKDISHENKKDEENKSSYFNAFFGLFMMIIGVILFSLSTVFCKLAYMNNPNLSGFDYLIVRSLILTCCALFQAFSQKVNLLDIKKEGRLYLALRCFLGILASPMFYCSIKFLPTSKATLISKTHPLFVTLCGYLFLKEKMTKYDTLAVIGAFAGVVTMNINKTDSTKIETSDYLTILGVILCAGAMLLGVGVSLSIRVMNKHLHYMMNPAWFAFTLTLSALSLLIVYPSLFNFKHYTVIDMVWFFLSGVLHFIHQNFISIAYKYQEASKISPLSYFSGVFLLFSDFIIFGYEFSLTDYIGLVLVTGFLLLPIIYKLYVLKK
ncbi:unnamed protein product [Moneuplotes crassus]|uniref:EamA domain-containing protein n=2 Tax=Euplotes crassus TaxID=5936 RepID=A0AAD1UFR9_EUPCR|nr:unnamed protein product [Moneuplotes crassus]